MQQCILSLSYIGEKMPRHIMKMDWKALGYQAKYEIIDNNITVIWENMTAISEAKSAAGEDISSVPDRKR
jgi:hypothetical protein